jgi:translation elongation factor EF-G
VTVEYDDSGTVRGILESESEESGAGVEFEADYEERVTFEIRVPVEAAAGLRDRIRSATSGRGDISSE